MATRNKKTRADEDRVRDFAALDRIGEAFKDVPLAELEREIAGASEETRRENEPGA